MIVLKIIGIILAAIILLLCLVLFLPVKVIFELESIEEVKIYVRFLFMTFGKKKKKSKVADTVTKATGVSKKDKKVKDKKDIRKIVDLVVSIIKQFAQLVQHCKLEKLNVQYISAGEDPSETAMEYGYACAAIYPVTGVLYSIMDVKDRGVTLNVGCDFQKTDTVFEFYSVISVRVVHLLVAVIKFLIEQSEK